jgi:Family of unknown function (DUF6263)
MNKKLLFAASMLLTFSCKIHPGSDRDNAGENKIFRLRLNPPMGSTYRFSTTNSVNFKTEVNDKEIEQVKKTDVDINYSIDKDSAGNLVFSTTYDRIHLYTKDQNGVTDIDAANAATSVDPMEKMLGALKTATIVATVSPSGAIKTVTGYEEVSNRILT